MNRYSPIIILSFIFIISLFSCIGTAPTREVRLVDSLNQQSYAYRYKNIDSAFKAAWTAYEKSSIYMVGKAEACNNMGFCAFMQMNFDSAEKLFKEVYTLTQNELELLIADIGLMKIYQRAAMNKEFYDYRNNAILRINRIEEDKSLFLDRNEKKRMNFAFTEYSIVSAIYYYYLQQVPEAISSINEIKAEELVNDTSQLLYYHYIKGSASLTGEQTADRRRLSEFDELFQTWRLASEKGYLYFEGNGLQGLANLMISRDNLNFFINRRSHAMNQFGVPVDSLLPLELARTALKKFREYNDIYQIAGAYVSIGRYLNEHGHYQEALDSLTKALDCVNLHHKIYYGEEDDDDEETLKPYAEQDMYTEDMWLLGINEENSENANKVKTVPEWISRIREQLSVSYAGLGMKVQSDYNRNIYLRILQVTRQNKEFESRYLVLEEESRQLNTLLLIVLFGIIILIVLFWVLNNQSKKRNRIYISRLETTLEICQKITSSIPSDVEDEESIVNAIKTSILPDMQTLTGATDIEIILTDEEREPEAEISTHDNIAGFQLSVSDKSLGVFRIATKHRLSKDDRALINIIVPYISWTLDNGMTLLSLGEEREKLEKKKYIFDQHIARNKRENIIKKTCLAIVNGIIPYIDRIINEIYKLKEKGYIKDARIKKEKYQYIDELVTTINEYNDILALWIKMKQGSLSLNIENFELNDLFLLVGKGRKTFEMKKQSFEIEPTNAVIKADRALTLFMINTLTENARKYTPEGGSVKVYAENHPEYIEISVEDDGRGLTEEDVALIKDEKLYDSSQIGTKNGENIEELKKIKGSGFGLMNCKGIIEKYKKTNKLFQVCLFSVESTLGKGSRFYFRLPVGIKKNLGLFLLLLLPLGLTSCHVRPTKVTVPYDSIALAAQIEYGRLLDDASKFADTVYSCNVYNEYSLALQYVDSAMNALNRHYQKYAKDPRAQMELVSEETPAEMTWWGQRFETDYDVILSLRNEAAVSLLALKEWDAYTFNNRAYTALYKLIHEDQSIEAFCMELERSTTNKIVAIALCILILAAYLIGYYIFYMRKRMMNMWNLEQVLEINEKVFSSAIARTQDSVEALQMEENALKEIPLKIVNAAYEAINELLSIDTLGLAVYNASTNKLEFASYPQLNEIPGIVDKCFDDQSHKSENDSQAFPLIVDAGGNHQCVGVLFIETKNGTGHETDRLLLELISRYVGVVVFNSVVRLAMRYRDIESAYEDTHRASWEDSMLHVQNMVLDNCLSTIKHETIYYPNKIKQIITKLSGKDQTEEDERENIETISELIDYYKGIFTILSSCASRQLEEVTFRRTTIPTTDLIGYGEMYFRKQVKLLKQDIRFTVINQMVDRAVIGDQNQLYFILENLINEALSYPTDGELILETTAIEKFIEFRFTDKRREKTVEELNQLFYPDLARMTAGDKGELQGTEYLICKQIIRDHDEYTGRRGCRINAEPAREGGFTVYFTIPEK